MSKSRLRPRYRYECRKDIGPVMYAVVDHTRSELYMALCDDPGDAQRIVDALNKTCNASDSNASSADDDDTTILLDDGLVERMFRRN